jgi:hypothetical protein
MGKVLIYPKAIFCQGKIARSILCAISNQLKNLRIWGCPAVDRGTGQICCSWRHGGLRFTWANPFGSRPKIKDSSLPTARDPPREGGEPKGKPAPIKGCSPARPKDGAPPHFGKSGGPAPRSASSPSSLINSLPNIQIQRCHPCLFTT